MKWVKIEDGCEMPRFYESVAISNGYAWQEGWLENSGEWYSAHNNMTPVERVTHWARVELPEE